MTQLHDVLATSGGSSCWDLSGLAARGQHGRGSNACCGKSARRSSGTAGPDWPSARQPRTARGRRGAGSLPRRCWPRCRPTGTRDGRSARSSSASPRTRSRTPCAAPPGPRYLRRTSPTSPTGAPGPRKPPWRAWRRTGPLLLAQLPDWQRRLILLRVVTGLTAERPATCSTCRQARSGSPSTGRCPGCARSRRSTRGHLPDRAASPRRVPAPTSPAPRPPRRVPRAASPAPRPRRREAAAVMRTRGRRSLPSAGARQRRSDDRYARPRRPRALPGARSSARYRTYQRLDPAHWTWPAGGRSSARYAARGQMPCRGRGAVAVMRHVDTCLAGGAEQWPLCGTWTHALPGARSSGRYAARGHMPCRGRGAVALEAARIGLPGSRRPGEPLAALSSVASLSCWRHANQHCVPQAPQQALRLASSSPWPGTAWISALRRAGGASRQSQRPIRVTSCEE